MVELSFASKDGPVRRCAIGARTLGIAGWTGRDVGAVQAHVDELAAMGVAPPARTPAMYRVASSLLTTQGSIEVVGDRTSGEAEFVLLRHAGELWVGVGSDHTCRALEMTSVVASKQCCAKPLGKEVWRADDVRAHWDSLELRSYAEVAGRRLLYQSSTVSHLLSPASLLALCDTECVDLNEGVLFCGTVPLVVPWMAADAFACELRDPVLGRTLECRYTIRVLGQMAASPAVDSTR